MSRGRPRKNTLIENIKGEEVKTPPPVKDKNKYNICDICGKEYKITPRVLNFTYITSVANYHRRCSTDKFKVCTDCAEEFSTVIDNWVIKKNPELRKFRF